MSVPSVLTSLASEHSNTLLQYAESIEECENALEGTIKNCFQTIRIIQESERTRKKIEEDSKRSGLGPSVEILQSLGEFESARRRSWTKDIAGLEQLNEAFKKTVNTLSHRHILTYTNPGFETVRNALILRAFVAQSIAHFYISALRV